MSKTVAYVRVSTKDQCLERQLVSCRYDLFDNPILSLYINVLYT